MEARRLRSFFEIRQDWEGHEFYSRRKSRLIKSGFQPLGESRLAKQLFSNLMNLYAAGFRI